MFDWDDMDDFEDKAKVSKAPEVAKTSASPIVSSDVPRLSQQQERPPAAALRSVPAPSPEAPEVAKTSASPTVSSDGPRPSQQQERPPAAAPLSLPAPSPEAPPSQERRRAAPFELPDGAGGRRRIKIGDVAASSRHPLDVLHVPFCSAPYGVLFPTDAQPVLGMLRWMLQKHTLRQDMFLLGEPGPSLRQLVAAYCQLVGKELEYVAVTQDTSEADLKQRREVIDGRLVYVDQAPVRAAVHGRVLLLEGVEKAERNVLPTLNNLLENREMALEDRSFLVAPQRATAIFAKQAGSGTLPQGMRAVSQDFEVIAIGQPDRGNPLDPPLRSRFVAKQTRSVDFLGSVAASLEALAPALPASAVTAGCLMASRLEAFAKAQAQQAPSSEEPPPPPFPVAAIGCLARLAALCPKTAPQHFVQRVYPGHLPGVLTVKQRHTLLAMLSDAKLVVRDAGAPVQYDASEIRPLERSPAQASGCQDEEGRTCVLTLTSRGARAEAESCEVHIPCGRSGPLRGLAKDSADSPQRVEKLNAQIRSLEEERKGVELLPGSKLSVWLSLQQVTHEKTADRRTLMALTKQTFQRRRQEIEAQLEQIQFPLARDLGGVRLAKSQQKALTEMVQDHAAGADICLVGDRGTGKSSLVRAFAAALGYRTCTMFCYRDMTSRDLLQRRTTDERGNTIWQNSPLLDAAVSGDLAVLDGVHRLAKGVLYSTLAQLLHDREVVLANGSRLVSPSHFSKLLSSFSAQTLSERGVVRVHPAFRIIAMGEPPSENKAGWLNAEAMTLFHFVEVRALSSEEQLQLSVQVSGGNAEALKAAFEGIAGFRERIERAAEADPSLSAMSFSLRQMLRIARHLAARPGDLHGALDRSISARLRFLPKQAQEAVDNMLASAVRMAGGPKVSSLLAARDEAVPGEHRALDDVQKKRAAQLVNLEGFAIATRFGGDDGSIEGTRKEFEDYAQGVNEKLLKDARTHAMQRLSSRGKAGRASPCKVLNGVVSIEDVSCRVRTPSHPELVPNVYFVDMPQHVRALRDMLLDWTLGQHLLLIGNQGVGKNKLADRLLGLLHCEREYVQLHRDTTVQSLTISQALEGGAVVREDSALVRAARHGRCLVVDEADKAPPEVVCVLKALVDDGELVLGDGRVLAARGSSVATWAEKAGEDGQGLIRIADGFRMIILANRPGYPFHGNDFYRACGDVFSCHVVSNPDLQSEVDLLQEVGPGVKHEHLAKLALLFRELRDLADSGQLAYPYSTRELVKVAKHLERFKDEQPERALRDVFAFDLGDTSKRQMLLQTLARHGFAVDTKGLEVILGKEHGNMKLRLQESGAGDTNPDNPDGENPPDMREGGPKHGEWDGKEHIGGNIFAGGSGGTGTAGLGGRWGPYRLDVGQTLVMVPEHLKEGIDQEVQKKALKMAREAHAKHMEKLRLAGPNMEKYQSLRNTVLAQAMQMRAVLEAHEARERERIWLRQQTHGELDDTRLVDGIVGGRAVYMRRGEPDASAFRGEQKLPKRMMFMLDISGSMYTFNRLDGRMQRLQELVFFLLEAFDGMTERYDICMVGHSGSGAEAERLVEWGRPVRSAEERLHIIERMAAHAQFAAPGDRTLEAAQLGVREVVSQPADEYFVFLVSDADLKRYNITGEAVSRRLTADKRVHGYVILISNNTGEADEITSAVAPGRAHICAQKASLSSTFKTIFTHAVRAAEEAEGG